MNFEFTDPIGDGKNMYIMIDFKLPRWLVKPKSIGDHNVS